MKANIVYKNDCITVLSKNVSETLYDDDLVSMITNSNSVSDFTNAVYDYFVTEMDDVEINFKELSQICKKVYNKYKS